MGITVEICCGGYEDALNAARGGAGRIELNSALYLGGLTPGYGTFRMARKIPNLSVIAMVRPRGGGFLYSGPEYRAMLQDAEEFLEAGADGIAFGFLRADRTIDAERTAVMTERIHAAGKTAVFHRAFDCTDDFDESMEKLIGLGVDRVLTSGGKGTAWDGREVIRHLEEVYGSRIQILAGSGINETNAAQLIKETGVRQIHSSCRMWKEDHTAQGGGVSFAYADGEHRTMFEAVSVRKVSDLVNAVGAGAGGAI